ncbi:MAG: CotH kinase family protein [Clostridia bacterium]|nr:CotH kinase family protein [Clostridia bacterium]
MKTFTKIFAVLMLCCMLFSIVGCQPPTPPKPHECSTACEVCGGCQDVGCEDPACANKCNCDGTHKCESVCPECGKCTDKTCTEDACAQKCTCNDAPAHVCESVCPECGGCKDLSCAEAACARKCDCKDEPAHTCQNVCAICGKCTNSSCTEDVCKDKCQGHGDVEPFAYQPHIFDEMPRIDINTEDGSNEWATKYNRNDKLAGIIDYVDSTVSVSRCPEDWVLEDLPCEVKVRGNYTLEYEKKPIRLKFNKKQAMLGLNEGEKFKSWVLLADWKDLSLQQNATTFLMGQYILEEDGLYSSDYTHVEVYLNGQYWGVYLLVEQQQTNRLDTTEPDDDYEGTDIGYLFEYDGYWNLEDPNKGGDYTFSIDYGNVQLIGLDGQRRNPGVNGYTIKSDTYSTAQRNFIKNYTNNVFKMLYQAAVNNKYYKFNDDYTALVETTISGSVYDHLNQYVDIQSFVDTYIMHEIMCDPDIGWSSFYLHVDFGPEGEKRLRLEAPWDKDSAYGIRSGFMNSATGMYAANNSNPWLVVLINEDWFQEMVKDKWVSLKEKGLLNALLTNIETLATHYKEYYDHNFERWENRVIYGNGELTNELNSYRTEREAADYLKRWLTKRFGYLDRQWIGQAALPESEALKVQGTKYIFEAESAQIAGGINAKQGNGSHGNGYVGNVAGGAGKTITFTVNSTADQKVGLILNVSKRDYEAMLLDWFKLTVNGKDVQIEEYYVLAVSGGEENWHAWVEIPLAALELKQGANTIVITTIASDATNVDYLAVVAPNAVN